MQGLSSSPDCLTNADSKLTQAARDWPMVVPAPTSSRPSQVALVLLSFFEIHLYQPDTKLSSYRATMENQRRHNSWNQSLGGATKRPDKFWNSIVPSALLEKKEPQRGTRAHPGYHQTKHARDHKPTQPIENHRHVDVGEDSGGRLLARSPALHKGGKEVDSSAESDDTEISSSDDDHDEDVNGSTSETTFDASRSATPLSRLSYVTDRRASTQARTNFVKRSKEPSKTTAPKHKTTGSQLTEVQSNLEPREDAAARELAAAEQQRDTTTREGAYTKARHAARGGIHLSTPQSDVARRDQRPSDRSSDIAQKLAAALATQEELRITVANLTNEIQNERYAKETDGGTADASARGQRSRKRVKIVVEESDEESFEYSDEESYQDSDEESDQGSNEESDEEAANRNVNLPVKRCARGKNVSGLRVLPPLSRNDEIWTAKEEEIVFNLRMQGKNWEYIGEELGRTASAARGRWNLLRVESLRPIAQRSQRVHSTSVLSAMTKLGRKYAIWTAKEEETLFNLRKKGKSWKYIGKELDRTVKAAKNRWDSLRVESLQPIKPRSKGARVHSTSVLSAMAKLGAKQRQWTEKEDSLLISLRAQGKTMKQISRRIPGRPAGGCKGRWLKIRHLYPQQDTAFQDLKSNKKEIPSDHTPTTSDQEPSEYSDEDFYQHFDEESGQDSEEESDDEDVVDTSVERFAKGRARGKNASSLRILPPISRTGLSWTTREDETLLSLRKQGKGWKYIGEDVLGRTAKAAQDRWGGLRREFLRTVSLQPIKTRRKGVRRVRTTADLSGLAKLRNRNRPWTKEEESKMISLRAQGKTIKYISGRLPGRSYEATQIHWTKKIRARCPQAVTASQDLESKEKEFPSDHSPFFPRSQLDHEAMEPRSKSHFAVVVPQYPKSRIHCQSGSSR